MSRTFHIDTEHKRVLITDHPSVKRHLLIKGYKLADGPRAARLLCLRQGYRPQVVNVNYCYQVEGEK